MEKRYLVLIKSMYVRDAQAYIGDVFKNKITESGWWDVGGSMLVLDRNAESIDVIKEQIKILYPYADEKVFEIIECN